jgi:hypothetical protein
MHFEIFSTHRIFFPPMVGRKWAASSLREIEKLLSRGPQFRADTDCYMQGNLKISAPRLAFLQANSSRHFVYGW